MLQEIQMYVDPEVHVEREEMFQVVLYVERWNIHNRVHEDLFVENQV